MNIPSKLLTKWNKIYWNSLRRCINTTISKAVDLGSGPEPKNDFNASDVIGIDIRGFGNKQVLEADLFVQPIPLPDESVDLVTAYDFLEHVPRISLENGSTRFPFIELMNEIHRILVPGGYFFSYTPTFPKREAFVDPTHVNIMTKHTILEYFCGASPIATMYGFNGTFKEVRSGKKGVHHALLIRKVPSGK